MLAMYNVVIYQCSGVVLGKQVESKFTKHTGNKRFNCLLPYSKLSDSSFDLSVQLRTICHSCKKGKCRYCEVPSQALS